MKFEKGTKVRVVNEKLAQGVAAIVSNGDTGEVLKGMTKMSAVIMDNNSVDIFPWNIPNAALEEIK